MSHYDRCICIHGWLFILIYVVFLLIIVLLLLFWSRRIKLNIMFPAEARNGWNLLPVKSNIKTVKSQWLRISCLPDRRETLQTNCLKRFAYFSPNFYSGKSAQFGLDFRPQLRLTRSSFEKKPTYRKLKHAAMGAPIILYIWFTSLNSTVTTGPDEIVPWKFFESLITQPSGMLNFAEIW